MKSLRRDEAEGKEGGETGKSWKNRRQQVGNPSGMFKLC